jgi:pimeloyl-ACP methyl ester carboxylesterase
MELQHVDLPPSEGVAGGDVAYVDVGEGPTIVLVHGYPGRPADYRWMVPALEGVRVVAPALPGLDDTPLATCDAATITGRGRFLAAFLEALDLRGVLVGHSMGAGVCAVAAVEQPDRATGLGLLAPLGLRPHKAFRRSTPNLSKKLVDQRWMRWWTMPLLRYVFVAMGFPRGLSEEAMVHTLDCAAAMDFEALRARYAQVQVPCLIASCDDDPLIEPAIPLELGAALPDGPRLRWDTGLHGIVKSRATELGDALGAFTQKLD